MTYNIILIPLQNIERNSKKFIETPIRQKLPVCNLFSGSICNTLKKGQKQCQMTGVLFLLHLRRVYVSWGAKIFAGL